MTADPVTERLPVVAAAPPPELRTHPARRVFRWVVSVLLLVVLVVAGAVVIVPAAAGASALTVLSGSMEPTLPVGSTVVVRPRPVSEISVGSIITFTDRDAETGATRTVTHRVVGVEQGPAFRTMGDANDAPDPGLVQAADVHGVEWYVVPYVGLVRARLLSPAGMFVGAGLLLLVLALQLLIPQTRAQTTAAPVMAAPTTTPQPRAPRMPPAPGPAPSATVSRPTRPAPHSRNPDVIRNTARPAPDTPLRVPQHPTGPGRPGRARHFEG